jgi:hypothetical protein
MKKVALLLIAMAAMILSLSVVFAATPGEAEVTGETDLGEFVYAAADQNVSVEAGNIISADLDSNVSTYRWSGLLGNVSGNIVLGDSSNQVLYSWVASGRVVYATTAGSVNWGSVVAEDGTNVDAFFDGAGDSDNFTNTFNETGALDSGILTGIAAAPRATTNGGTGWYTYALYDTANVIFAGNVVPAGDTSYSGSSVQYQMIIPEDGTAGDTGTTAYNLWVELQ